MGPRPIVNDCRRDQEASQSVAPVAPIVHYVGSQIFANELHEPVALTVIKYVVERHQIDGPDWKLVVSDNGVGKPDAANTPAKGGLGTTLVKALA
jgi:two-component sensor histidine kinase